MGKRKVSYYYDNRLDNLSYGVAHPMKISRIKMTHQLVMAYDLHEKMSLYRPSLPELKEFNTFHTSDYIEFLSTATPSNFHIPQKILRRLTHFYFVGKNSKIHSSDGNIFSFLNLRRFGLILSNILQQKILPSSKFLFFFFKKNYFF